MSIFKHANAIVESRKNCHQAAEYERRRNFGVSDTPTLLEGSVVREVIAHSKRPTPNAQRPISKGRAWMLRSMLDVGRLQAKKVG